MNRCPRCQRVVPDWQAQCQFCGAQISPIQGKGGASHARARRRLGPAPWVWFAYYAVCVYFIISGLINIVNYYSLPPPDRTPLSTIALGIGVVTALGGLGLALHIEIVRGIANVLAFIKMIMGGITIVNMVFCGWVLGPFALIPLFFGALDVATGGLLIFLIGETDTRTPDI